MGSEQVDFGCTWVLERGPNAGKKCGKPVGVCELAGNARYLFCKTHDKLRTERLWKQTDEQESGD